MVGPINPGQILRAASNGGRVNVVTTEDDDLSQPGPKATTDSADDAVDDAANVRVLFLLVP